MCPVDAQEAFPGPILTQTPPRRMASGKPAGSQRMAFSSRRNCILRFKSRCGACVVHFGTPKLGSLCCVVRFHDGDCPLGAQGVPRMPGMLIGRVV